jgi:mannose-6-phosphate isomerase-like protein (cupin superfamily)
MQRSITVSNSKLTQRDGMNAENDALVHRDGHRVRSLGQGTDEAGRFLRIEHVWIRPGPMAGPHWHPVLTESFTVEEGRMRFRVDGRDFSLGAERASPCGRARFTGSGTKARGDWS